MYTKEFPYDKSKHPNCVNQELKKYYIEKYDNQGAGDYAYSFNAVLHPGQDWLSQINADHGECDDVSTKPAASRCGFATYLMTLCMLDADVTRNGGVDVDKDELFKLDKKATKDAKEHCNNIVYVHAAPLEVKAAIYILNAGVKAGYNKLFANVDKDQHRPDFDVMDTTEAVKEFLDGPQGAATFMVKHGENWYFCQWH